MPFATEQAVGGAAVVGPAHLFSQVLNFRLGVRVCAQVEEVGEVCRCHQHPDMLERFQYPVRYLFVHSQAGQFARVVAGLVGRGTPDLVRGAAGVAIHLLGSDHAGLVLAPVDRGYRIVDGLLGQRLYRDRP